MLKTLELLEKSKIVKSYEVLDFKKGKDFYYLKIRAVLIDDSTLHIREFVSPDDRSYSYNWIDKNVLSSVGGITPLTTKTLKRFLITSTQKNGVEDSFETTLEDVLSLIEKEIL